MKEMILKLVLEWLAKYLTKEQLEQWVEALKVYAIPKLYLLKDEFLAKARQMAKETPSKIDDMFVDKLALLLDVVLPPVGKPVQVPAPAAP